MKQSSALKLSRIQSIDFLRGAVMIIMAIDHVRVYSGIPAGGLTAGIFFTRWITHFCAPAFTFLAGTSAYLYLQKSGDKTNLAKFLVTRGLLLVILEVTVIRFFWTFNFDYGIITFTGVIWMLGWCMIILAALIRLRPVVIGVTGICIIFFQQAFQYVPQILSAPADGFIATLWRFFYPASSGSMAGAAKLTGISSLPEAFGIRVFYVIIPWIGVMMAGFWFGQVFRDGESLKRKCIGIGVAAIVLFISGATFLSTPISGTPFIFTILGQQKYPPSQLYLLMTLGPVIALVPWAERIKGGLVEAVKIIGRVPMFYYLVHLLLIHISALVINILFTGSIQLEWYSTVPFVHVPENERWGLPLLYFVWAIDIVLLYLVCRWYAIYKSIHPEKQWLKYL